MVRLVANASRVNTGGVALISVVGNELGQPVIVLVAVKVYVPSLIFVTTSFRPVLPTEFTGRPAAPVGAHA